MIKLNKTGIYFVSLLTMQEWKDIVAYIPNIPIELGKEWWLQTPCWLPDNIWTIDAEGNFNSARRDHIRGIRPIVAHKEFAHKPRGIHTGEKFLFENTTFTCLDNNWLLADAVCGQKMFDIFTVKFDNSAIRKYINSSQFINSL